MLSMTGHGSAALRDRGLDVEVEIRSVNHRFLNLKQNLPSALSSHEGEVDQLLRGSVRRGSLMVSISAKQRSRPGVGPDSKVLRTLFQKLRKTQKAAGIPGEITMETLLGLPNLWIPDARGNHLAERWPRIRKLLGEALRDHGRMRAREGKGIQQDLLRRLGTIDRQLKKVLARVPRVIAAHERKMLERINTLVRKHGLEIARPDLLKEIAIFADKSDISEEIQRLQSHCRQFRKFIRRPGQVGRKLDFLTQEMVRETNTLSAKSSDSVISTVAVEIKSELEKIKEQAENVE